MDTQDTSNTTPTPESSASAPVAAATPTASVSDPAAAPAETKANDNRTLMGVLAYLGILIIIPYLMAKDDPFVHFHIKQGAVLCAIWIVGFIAEEIVWILFPIVSLINLGLLALAIVGIVKVVQGKQEELPVVGSLAKHIPL